MNVNYPNIIFPLVLLLVLTSFEVDAKVYKWIDQNGTIHFSDTPYSGEAKEVNVKSTGIKVTGSKSQPGQADEMDARQEENLKPNNPKETEVPKEITEDDYRITSSVGKMGADTIRVAGRIGSGPKCENLSIEATAASDTGLNATVNTVTRKVTSFGSTTFEGYSKVTGSADDFGIWKVTKVTVRCND